MAIDSEKKRRAAAGAGIPGQTLPLPDGTVDSGDRAQLSGVYAPAAGGPPPTPTTVTNKRFYGDGMCYTFK